MPHKIQIADEEYIVDSDDVDCIGNFFDILKIYESDKKYENYLINIKKTFTVVKAYHAGPNQDITQDRLDKFLSQFLAWVSSGLIMTVRFNDSFIKKTNDFGKYLLKIFEKLKNKNLDEHSLNMIKLLEYYFKNKDKRSEIVELTRQGSMRDLAAKRKRESDARSQLEKNIPGTSPAVSQSETTQEKKQKTEDNKINQEHFWLMNFDKILPYLPKEIVSDPNKLQAIKNGVEKINALTKDLIDVVPIIEGTQLGQALANPDLPIFMIPASFMGKKPDSRFTIHIKGETAQAGRSVKVEVNDSGYKIGKEIFTDLESLLKHLELPLKKGPKPA